MRRLSLKNFFKKRRCRCPFSGKEVPPSLNDMPEELLERIFSMLDGRSVCAIEHTCRRFKQTIQSWNVWQRVVERDVELDFYETYIGRGMSVCWKSLYADWFSARCVGRGSFSPGGSVLLDDGIVAMTVCDTHVYTGGATGLVTIHDTNTAQSDVIIVDPDRKTPVSALAVRGNRMLCGFGSTLGVYDLAERRPVTSLVGHTKTILCVALHGDVAVSGASDYTLRVWNLSTMQCTLVLEHPSCVMSAIITKCGLYVITSCWDGNIRLWNDQGVCVNVLSGHQGPVWDIKMQGTMLASASHDSTVRIWDIMKLECVRVLYGHSEPVKCIDYRGTTVVSGSWDRTIKVWDLCCNENTPICCLQAGCQSVEGARGVISCLRLRGPSVVASYDNGLLHSWTFAASSGQDLCCKKKFQLCNR